MAHESFQTVDGELNWDDPMFKLYNKAKKNMWDPTEIDFSQDKIDFDSMTEDEKITAAPLVAAFSAGEEAVTIDILPMVHTMARQGRLEDTMFLTTFMFDEAKHMEMFSRWQNAVGIADMNLSIFHNDNYKRIFYEKLPESMERLTTDDSPEAVIRAATVYNMIVEGVLAKTGFQSFREIFKKANLLPGILQGIDYVNMDEGRHLRFGIYTIQRLIAGNDKYLKVFNDYMEELRPDANGYIEYLIDLHQVRREQGGEDSRLALDTDQLKAYASNQFEIRKNQVNKAKNVEGAAEMDDQLEAEK